ncbi:hypothetical protein [Chryseobacterium sp. R2A-55]|uniref:hypothetical protein n=1 Tax=Chryseobacterium sp. R2A-55 TaxID=2744445 RepID=UPI001F1FBDA4|nr:hypothetical protein [Chryseobacterium sp. R2A-55]
MKKLLLIFLFISGFGFGQITEYAIKLNNLSSAEQAKEVADDIMNGFSSPRKFAEQYVNYEKYIVFKYYDTAIPNEEIEKDMKLTYCKLCDEVKFMRFFRGADKDLGIQGNETYSLKYVSGKYLDLFPWWEKHFAKGIGKEDLLDKESNKRYIEDRQKRINIRFVKNGDDWEIRNIH